MQLFRNLNSPGELVETLLEENYRSRPKILRVADYVLKVRLGPLLQLDGWGVGPG